MLFNSLAYLLFLPAVFLLYWFVFKRLKVQNWFVIAASYFFYGWWDWRFLSLLLITSLSGFVSGLALERYESRQKRRLICTANIVLNLLILGLFKYFNFFADSLAVLCRSFGYEMDAVTLNLVLPVGISFYTFQALSYTIDVYRRTLPATHDVAAFFAYISFFPQMMAGPIERATNLLPQFLRPRTFDCDAATDGLRQILWGFFKKVVIADNCATYVNVIFEHHEGLSGSTLLLGAFFFTIQIYCDFSGYSDIAIGSARLFGIRLMQNFRVPYFSRDVAEFWRRWHISLTTWFRDYVYIPLGGSRFGKWTSFRNTMVIFLLSGLWHGANWTFVLWGAYHALLFLPLLLLHRNRRFRDVVAAGRSLPTFGELFRMASTFVLVLLGWILFRAESFSHAIAYIQGIFTPSLFSTVYIHPAWNLSLFTGIMTFVFILVMFLFEWLHRDRPHALCLRTPNMPLRTATYTVFLLIVYFFNAANPVGFIYFQF
ncbi:MAG: MBOAT family protein [Tannerellaceae bacterium]|jgi:D-alanyl-lipoteichoic acid acyltransferase DltB (MBOAT superfamily)|nr:MBOAT family protein [Tannerellaceae bacterium]